MIDRRRMLVVMAAVLLAVTLAPAPVAAQSLDSLRASGAIGERFDGYAEARDSSTSAMVRDINAKRQAIYKKRAAEQGIAPGQVGRVYAKEIMADAPSGTFFLREDGSWVQSP